MKGTIWCLHGAVGMAEDWRGFSVPGWATKRVDLWRFLDCCPMGLKAFGVALNEEARAVPGRKVLLGYSMGGRLALHALLADSRPWDAAVVVSAHPGLEDEDGRKARRASDAEWAARALKGDWREFLAAWNGQEILSESGEASIFGIENRRRLEGRRQAVARSFMDWSLGTQEALAGRLSSIHCPLLWCVGANDSKFRRLGELVMADFEKGGTGVRSGWVAEGAGHRVPWEVGEGFAKKVGEFLEPLDS
ncbi:MAG: alpha/beta fold hydrolase [Verrucomicrobiales bacterium]